jgi:hypothetical protein
MIFISRLEIRKLNIFYILLMLDIFKIKTRKSFHFNLEKSYEPSTFFLVKL